MSFQAPSPRYPSRNRILTSLLAAANRPNFLKYLDPDSTPDNTVLFAKIASHEAINQALIPPPIIDEGEIYLAQCAERGTDASEQLGQMGYADWDLENLPGWGLGADAK